MNIVEKSLAVEGEGVWGSVSAKVRAHKGMNFESASAFLSGQGFSVSPERVRVMTAGVILQEACGEEAV